MINTIKDFWVVNEAELNVFLEFPCFLYDPANVGNSISGSSAFSKPSLYIWKFSVQMLLKPSLKDFEHNLTSMGNKYKHPLALPFLGIGMRIDLFYPVAAAEFSRFADILTASL